MLVKKSPPTFKIKHWKKLAFNHFKCHAVLYYLCFIAGSEGDAILGFMTFFCIICHASSTLFMSLKYVNFYLTWGSS